MTWPLRRPAAPLSCSDLDLKRVAREIVAAEGSIPVAAKKLGVPASDLRTLARAVPALDAAAAEGLDRLLDQAWAVIFDSLESPDMAVRAKAATAMLRASPAAWRRGAGAEATARSWPGTDARDASAATSRAPPRPRPTASWRTGSSRTSTACSATPRR